MTTISWSAPTTFPNGNVLVGNEITGYKIYVKSGATYSLYDTTTETSINVPDGVYAVCATFSSGQTALSDSITVPDWTTTIEQPNAGNTVSSSDTRTAIQNKIDALTAGGVLYFRGGTYSHTLSSVFLTLGVSGSSGNYINIINYPGELPILEGAGWADDDVGPSITPFALVEISGSYIRFKGFSIKDSGGVGVAIHGNYNHISHCHSYNNWNDGFRVGDHNGFLSTTDVVGNIIEYCVAHHNPQGNGVLLIGENTDHYFVDSTTVRRCLFYENGRDDNGSLNIFGGGNSDAIGASKYFHDDYVFNSIDVSAEGRSNRAHDTHILQTIGWRNGDDGYDINTGEGTLLLGNIAFHNYPSGTKGYKMLRGTFEHHTYIGNAALSNTASNDIPTEIYFTNGDSEFQVGEIVTGSVSGATATVVRARINTNTGGSWAGGNAEGVLFISGLSGSFRQGENLNGSLGGFATEWNIGQTLGVDHRITQASVFFDSGGTTAIADENSLVGSISGATATVDGTPTLWTGAWAAGTAAGVIFLINLVGEFQDDEVILVGGVDRATVKTINGQTGLGRGSVDEINWTVLNHNLPGAASDRGISSQSNPRMSGIFMNNLSHSNQANDNIQASFISSTNHLNTAGTPGLVNEGYVNPYTTVTGATIKEQWRNIYQTIMGQIMPTLNGNLYNSGTFNSGFHHAASADNATTPSDPDDQTKLAWFSLSKSSAKPDIGASQYQYIYAPQFISSSESTPLPLINFRYNFMRKATF